jgi:cobalt-zinc-cadmium efflux system outer membrane protein
MACPLLVRPARTESIAPRLALALAALLLAGPAAAQSAPPGRSVESFLALAREKNPEYAAMKLEAAAAGERQETVYALPDPRVRVELMDITNAGTDASPSLNPSKIGATKYTVMQTLPWFGKRDTLREAAEAEARAASTRSDATWVDLAARIKTAFAQYYLTTETGRLTREVLELMLRLESIAQARYAGGLSPQQDAIRAQVEQTTLRTDLVILEADRRRAMARLNALVSRPANAPLADPEQVRPLPPPARLQQAELEERARLRSPVLAGEEARARAADRRLELADLDFYPDFTLGVSPTQMGTRIAEWGVMLEVNIPLQRENRHAKEREARALLDAANARRAAAALSIQGQLEENLAALEAARRTEALAATSLVPQAELTFQSALASYENGKVDFATLLDAQRQILRAKVERLKAQAEAQMRLAEIERTVGEEL